MAKNTFAVIKMVLPALLKKFFAMLKVKHLKTIDLCFEKNNSPKHKNLMDDIGYSSDAFFKTVFSSSDNESKPCRFILSKISSIFCWFTFIVLEKGFLFPVL